MCWFATVTVMPDHVHFVGAPADGIAMPRLMQSIKSVSSHRVRAGRLWQPEYSIASFERERSTTKSNT
jgi:REP element-mobilizing transposase RayT